jgi:tetratricopeptide (TPR) repeat protein
LDPLSTSDAEVLFERAAGAERLSGCSKELVTEIVALCGRLPLAIRIAAARLRHRPAWNLADLAERLHDQTRRLAELHSGQRSVTTAIDLSYDHLEPQRQCVFRLLGLNPGPDIDTLAAAALTGLPEHTAAQVLDDLLDVHLVQQRRPNRYRFHDLVRVHAADTCARLDPPAKRDDALARLAEYYGRSASAAMDVVYPQETEQRPRLPANPHVALPELGDRAAAAAWLDTELTNLFAIAEHGGHGYTLHLSETLHRHLRTRGRYTEAEVLHDHAVRTARRTRNRRGEQDALNRLGHVHRMRERYEAAIDCFEQALLLARADGHRPGEHDALLGLGHVHRLQGRYEVATGTYRQVLVIARALGDHGGELVTLVSLGHVHRSQGQHDSAAEYLDQALTIVHTTADANGECIVRDAMGDLARTRGQYELAADQYWRSLTIARRLGHRVAELGALWGLGHAYRLQGRHDEAVDCYQWVLGAAREIGHRNSEFEARYGLGQTELATGNPVRALGHHDEALTIARDLSQAPDQARAHAGIAAAHHELGEPDQAHQHWERTTAILTDLGLTTLDEVDLEHVRARLMT